MLRKKMTTNHHFSPRIAVNVILVLHFMLTLYVTLGHAQMGDVIATEGRSYVVSGVELCPADRPTDRRRKIV